MLQRTYKTSERILKNFYFYCGLHDLSFQSLEAFVAHRREKNVNKNQIKVICECCGGYFTTSADLSKHHNVAGFNYCLATFVKCNANFCSHGTYMVMR